MASLNDLIPMGSPNQGQNPQQAYSDLYNQIVRANQNQQAQQLPQIQPPQLQGWYQGNPDQAPVREMSTFEKGVAGASDIGERLMGITGWDQSKGFTPENIGRFVLGLPFQMAGAPLIGAAQGYEAVTGENVLDRPQDQEGMVYDYDLDSGQRLAQLGNFGINTIGLFAGGSGRLLGNIGKAAGLGGIADRVAAGRLGQAYQNASRGKRLGIGIAGDVAEEASEEFGQSFLDDIRWNQLDEGSLGRAAEGAAWGALGGGVFSAAGRGLGHVLDKDNNPAAVNANPASPTSDVADGNPYSPYVESGTTEGHKVMSDTAGRFWGEFETGRSVSERPGSTNRKITLGMRGIGRDNMIFGTRPFEAMWRRSQADRDAILARYGAENEEAIEAALSLDNEQAKADALNRIHKKAAPNGLFKIAFGRNPQTKNGMFYLNMRGFAAGDFLGIDEVTAQVFGGDIDGDTASNFFDLSGINPKLSYASEMMLDPERRSNVDWSFTALNKDSDVNWDEKAKEFVDGCLYYTRMHEGDRKKLTESLATALKLKGGEKNARGEKLDRDVQVSEALTAIQIAMKEQFGKKIPNNYGKESKRYYRLFGSDEFVRREFNKQFEEKFEDLTEKDIKAAVIDYSESLQKKFEKEIEDNVAAGVFTKEESDRVLNAMGLTSAFSAGSKGDISHIIQAYRNFGFVLWHSPEYSKPHPTFRQYSEFGYNQVKAIPTFIREVSALIGQRGFDDVFKQMALSSYRVNGDGESPRTAIEGLVNEYIINETKKEVGPGFTERAGIATLEDFNKVLDATVSKWNDSCEIFNNAQEELHVKGWISPFDKKVRNPMKDVNDERFADHFLELYGSWDIGMILPSWKDTGLASTEGSQSVRSVVDRFAKNRDLDATVYGLSESEQNLLRRMVGSAVLEPSAVESRFMRTLDSINQYGTFGKVFKEGRIETEEDLGVSTLFMGIVNEFVGWNATRLFKLFDPRAWSKTAMGKRFFEGDTDTRASILVGMNYLGKFFDIVEWYAATEEQRASKGYTLEKVANELQELERIDAVHARIANEIRANNGRSLTLEMLIDINTPFSAKKHEFDNLFGNDRSLNIVDSSLKRPGSDEMASSASQTLVAMESVASSYIKRLRLSDYADLEQLESYLDNTGGKYSDQRISTFMMSQTGLGHMYVDATLLGAQVFDAMDIFNVDQEKATISLAYQGNYAFLDYSINGGPSSFLTDITSSLFGSITLDEFASMRGPVLRLLTDGKYRLTIQDPVSGEEAEFTREKIFKHYCGEDISLPPNQMPTDLQWLTLFREAPQLMGILTADAIRNVETENGVSSGFAKSFSFTNALKGYEEQMTRDEASSRGGAFSAAMEYNINWIGNKLLCETNWLPYVLRVLRNDVGETKFKSLCNNPNALSKALFDKHRELARWMHAMLYTNGDIDDLAAKYDKETRERLFGIPEMWDVVYMKISRLAAFDSSNEEYGRLLYKMTADEMKQDAFKENIIRLLEDDPALKTALDASHESFLASNVQAEGGEEAEQGDRNWQRRVRGQRTPGEVRADESIRGFDYGVRAQMEDLRDLAEEVSALSMMLSMDAVAPEGMLGFSPALSEEDFLEIKDQFLKLANGDPDLEERIAALVDANRYTIQAQAVFETVDAYEDIEVNGKSLKELSHGNPLFKKAFEISVDFARGRNSKGEKISEADVDQAIRDIGELLQDHALYTNDENDNRIITIKKDFKTDVKEGSYSRTLFHLKSLLYQAIITDLANRSNLPLNGNFAGSMRADIDMIHRILKDYPGELCSDTNFFGGVGIQYTNISDAVKKKYINDELQKAAPIANYTDSTVETICSKLITSQAAGGNPFKVSINGGETKHLSGLAWLDRTQTNGVPTPMKASRLVKMYDDGELSDIGGSRCHVRLSPDGEAQTLASCIDQLRDAIRLGDLDVEFFDPRINPHGLSLLNAPESFNPQLKDTHRLASIVLRIIQASQEQLVLKMKKKYAALDRFVDLKLKTDLRKKGEVSKGRKGLLDEYNGFLKEFVSTMLSDFKDVWVDEFKFGEEQAMILAQGLAIGFKVEVTDENGNPTGKFVHIDVSDIYDDAAFSARVNELLAQVQPAEGGPYGLGKATVYCVTPRTLSYRATRAANDALRADGNANPTEAVTRALSSYNDIKYDELSIERAFSKLPSAGWNFVDTLSLGLSPSPVMNLIDMTTGIRNPYKGAGLTFDTSKDVISIHNESTANSELANKIWGEISSLNRAVKIDDPNSQVIAIFHDGFEDVAGAGDIRNQLNANMSNGLFRDTVNPEKPYRLMYEDANIDTKQYVICVDGSKLHEAVEFAYNADVKGVIVPDKIAPGGSISRKLLDKKGNPVRITFSGEILPMESNSFSVVDPVRYKDFTPSYRRPQTPITPVETSMILNAMSARPDDTMRIAQLGDASGVIRASKAHLVKTYDDDSFDVDVSSYFHGVGGSSYSLVESIPGDQTIEGMISRIDMDSLKQRFKGQSFNEKEMEAKVRSFLERLDGNKDVKRLYNGVSRGQCVALVKRVMNGEVEYSPVFMPDTAPEEIDQVRVLLQGSKLSCLYSGAVYAADPTAWGWAKAAPERESMKMILVPIPDEQFPEGVDIIWSKETETGRVGGKEPGIVLGTLYYDMKAEGAHFLWQREGDHFKLKDWVQKLVDNGRVDMKHTIQDIHGESEFTGQNLWSILLSEKPEGLDITDAQLTLIRRVIRNARKFGWNPYDVLGATIMPDVENGNIGKRMSEFPKGQFDLAYGQLQLKDIRLLFNAIDPQICSISMTDPDQSSYRFDEQFKKSVSRPGSKGSSQEVVRSSLISFMADNSQMEGIGSRARYSRQAFYTQGIEHGYASREFEDAMRYGDFILGRPDYLERSKRMIDDDARMISLDPLLDRKMSFDENAPFYETYAEYRAQEDMRREFQLTMRHAPKVKIVDNGEIITDLEENQRLAEKIRQVEKAAGCKVPIPILKTLACMQYGWTYGNGEIDSFYISTFDHLLEQIADNWSKYGMPVMTPSGNMIGDRIPFPLLHPSLASWIWKFSSSTRSKFHGNKTEFDQAMKDQMNVSEGLVGEIKNDPAKKRSYQRFGTQLCKQWGLLSDGNFGYISEGMWIDDILSTQNMIGQLVRSDPKWDQAAYDALLARSSEQQADLVKRLQKQGLRDKLHVTTEYGGSTEIYLQQDLKSLQKILDGMAETSKVLAMWNPGVWASNFLDRTVGTKLLEFGLDVGRKGYGPYKTDIKLDQQIVSAAANNPVLQKIYIGLRLAAISGNELEALANMNDIHAMEAYLDERFEKAGKLGKIAMKTFELASGGNWMVRTQIENFINRFPMFAAEVPGLEFWQMEVPGQKVGEGADARTMTMLEAQLASNPAKWFVDILGGDANASASLTPAMQALNSAKKCDMAQRHVLGEIIGEFCRRTTLGKFLFTTCVSRFPNYALNVTHRILNYILPMSSIYYVFTSNAADIDEMIVARNKERGHGRQQSLHLENTQVHTSLKEAFLVDCTKLGTTAVMAILVGVSGLLQPPDDDDKWGNPDEWLVGGFRIGESWWLQDIMGIALPCAVYMKSAMLGRNNTNILFNGISNCCYSNPVLRISDAVGFVLDPEGNFFSDYEVAKERYADAPGGAPGFMDYISSNAASFGLSWTTQFFTPSIAREFFNNMQEYERSYNRVYARSASGKISEEGEYGATEKTTYADAMIRRATRKNPVLGFMLDMILQPETTGYMASEMPFTIYYDDAMLANAEALSIKGLDEEQAHQRVMEIYNYMTSFSSPDELQKTGFYLDYETKYALSEYIWDAYKSLSDQWVELGASGMLSYDVLGEGNWDLGKQIYYQMKRAVDDQKQQLNDFYYKWIKNSYLSESMTVYRRYNTTYAKDDNGEIYATGLRPQGVLPFVTAPGTATEAEGTAGYENDFMSVSAVTGQPMTQRALVPVEIDQEWPEFTYFSEDHDGSGYSSRWKDLYTGGSGTGTGNGSNPTYSVSSYRGGGSGGSGGGGGYSPNIYSRANVPNANNPSTVRRTATRKPNYDYLRPSFETKGSRESYKRSDI